MTNTGRAVVAVVAIVAATVLAALLRDATIALAVVLPAAGFVFGDRNAEKRTANAIAATSAEQGVDALVQQSLAKITAQNAASIVDVRDASSTTPATSPPPDTAPAA